MAELTDHAGEIMLSALLDQGPLVLILTRGGNEIADQGYEPQSLSMSQAQRQRNPSIWASRNTNEMRFGPWEETVTSIDGWAVRGSSDVLVVGKFEEAADPRRGQEVILRPGDVVAALMLR